MGERLLCKQEVVGSIPSASTVVGCAGEAVALGLRRRSRCVGFVVSWKDRVWALGAGSLPLGGVWRPGSEVRVFFMDCESGSGAFWARRTPRWVLLGCESGLAGLAGVVRGGFGLGV